MILRIFVFLLPLFLMGQQQLATLKKTLALANEKYNIVFTYDDDLMATFLAYSAPLPKTLEEFLILLKNEYSFQTTPQKNTILLAPSMNNSQRSLCGQIQCDLMEEGLQGTWVIVGNQFTQTDEKGFFSFENISKTANQIQFKNTLLGTVEMPFSTPYAECQDFYLNYSEIRLGEVIVNYISPPINKSTNGVFQIDINNALTSPGSIQPDLFELAQLLPGINSPNEDNALYVRGSTPDQNHILWNGIRVFQNHHANGGLSSLNPYGIENAQIMIKGVPAYFGEHTAGLIVLDNFQNPKQSGWKGSFGLGLLDTDLAVHYNEKDKFQTHISVRSAFNTTLSDTFKSNTFNRLLSTATSYESVTEQSIYYNDFTVSTKINLNPENNLTLQSFFVEDQIGYELTQNDFEYKDQLNARNFGMGMLWNNTSAQWSHRYHWSYSDFEMLFDRSIYQFEFDEEEQEYETEYSDLNKRDNHIKEGSFKTFHQKSVEKKYVFLWGTDLIYRDVALSNENVINQQERYLNKNLSGFTMAAYGGMKVVFSNKDHLETGLRYNYYQSINQSRLEPRINYTHFLDKRWSVNSTFEAKSQSIYRTNETINFGTNQSYNLWTGSGDELYPLLTASQASVGLTRKEQRTVLEADVYRKEVRGITTYNFGYIDPNDQDFHIGNASIFGVDVFLQRKWNQGNLWMSYTYQDNKNRFDDLKGGLWFNSNFLVNHQLNLGGNYTLNQWHIAMNYTLRSGVPYSEPTGVESINNNYLLQYDTLNDRFLPQYNRLDLSLSKRFIFGNRVKLDFKTAFKNLTNSSNVLERIFLYEAKSQTIKSVDRFSLEPFFNAGIRLFFD